MPFKHALNKEISTHSLERFLMTAFCLAIFGLGGICRGSSETLPQFVDVAPLYGLNVPSYSGCAIYDYDQDGDEDYLIGTGQGVPLLLEARNGTYTDIAFDVGLQAGAGGGSSYACGSWGDFDGDGDQDLYVCSQNMGYSNRLYVQYTELDPSVQYRFSSGSTARDGDGRAIDAALIVTSDQTSRTLLFSDNSTATLALSGVTGKAYGVLVNDRSLAENQGTYEVAFAATPGPGLCHKSLSASTNCIAVGLETNPSSSNITGNSTSAACFATLADNLSPGDYEVTLSGSAWAGGGVPLDSVYLLVSGATERRDVLLSNSAGTASFILGETSALHGVLVELGPVDDNTGELTVTVSRNDSPESWQLQLESQANCLDITGAPEATELPCRRFVDEADARGVSRGELGGSTQSADWFDVDQDGDLDLWVCNYGGSVGACIYVNEGGYFTRDTRWDFGSWSSCSTLCDYDRDGDTDIILAINGRGVVLFRNMGGEFVSVLEFGALGSHSPAPVWGDFDGDLDYDLFLAGGYSGSTFFPSYYLENTGTGFVDNTAGRGLDMDGITPATVLDFDNDGDVDIFAQRRGLGGLLFSNDGTGHFTEVAAQVGLRSTFGALEPRMATATDFDRDGDTDLFLMNYPSLCTLMRNDQPSPSPSAVSYSGLATGSPWVDGNYLKILVTDADGHWTRVGSTVSVRNTSTGKPLALQSVGLGAIGGTQSNYLVTVGLDEAATYDITVQFSNKGHDGQPIVVGPHENALLGALKPADCGHYIEVRDNGMVLANNRLYRETILARARHWSLWE